MYTKHIHVRALGIRDLQSKVRSAKRAGDVLSPGDSYPTPVVELRGVGAVLLTDEAVPVALMAGGCPTIECIVRQPADAPKVATAGKPRGPKPGTPHGGSDLETFGVSPDEVWEAHVACIPRWLLTARKALAKVKLELKRVEASPVGGTAEAVLEMVEQLDAKLAKMPPVALCPACKQVYLGCEECDGRGWVTAEELSAYPDGALGLVDDPPMVLWRGDYITVVEARKRLGRTDG